MATIISHEQDKISANKYIDKIFDTERSGEIACEVCVKFLQAVGELHWATSNKYPPQRSEPLFGPDF